MPVRYLAAWAACLLAAAGCREHGAGNPPSRPASGDSAFCFYIERAEYDNLGGPAPFYRPEPGGRILFRFGHRWSRGSEMEAEEYSFAIDTGRTRFSLDSTGFAAAGLRRDGGGSPSPSPHGKAAEHVEGERTTDSTWTLREWLSWDYREWRRRESYRAARPDLGRGFSRTCVRIPDPVPTHH